MQENDLVFKREKEKMKKVGPEGDSCLTAALSQTPPPPRACLSSSSRQSQEGTVRSGDGRKSYPEDRVSEGWLDIFLLKQELTLNSQIIPHPPQENLTTGIERKRKLTLTQATILANSLLKLQRQVLLSQSHREGTWEVRLLAQGYTVRKWENRD